MQKSQIGAFPAPENPYDREKGECMEKAEKKLKKGLLVVGMTGAVYGVFRFLLPLVIPFFAAWAASLLLRPSARWIAGHCQVTVRGRRFGVPVGIIGAAELVVVLVLLSAGVYFGCRKLCAEFSMLVDRLPVWIELLDVWLTGMCHRLEDGLCLTPGCLVLLVREMLRGLLQTIQQAAMPYLMANSVSVLRWGIEATVVGVVTLVAAGLCLQEMDAWKKRLKMSLFRREFALIGHRLSLVANAYLKTQGIIMLLTTVICTGGLRLMGNAYYLLAGIGIGILDALPVFGTGTVLIPWAVILFFGKHWGKGLALLVLYLICYFLREILEAKMMGDRVGLSPLENLISMYVGLQLFGIFGLLLGPVGLLLVRDLCAEMADEM